MDGHIDVYLYHGGTLVTKPELKYIGGDVHIVEDFDFDFLSIITVKYFNKKNLVYKNVKHVYYVLELGMNMNE